MKIKEEDPFNFENNEFELKIPQKYNSSFLKDSKHSLT